MGLNFYGYKFENSKMDAVVGHSFVDLLEQENVGMNWIEDVKEHVFEYGDVQVYYPTLKVRWDI
jgi:hypothetical protein